MVMGRAPMKKKKSNIFSCSSFFVKRRYMEGEDDDMVKAD